MKLRRLFAAFLALVLIVSASPFGTVRAVTEDAVDVAVVAAGDVQTLSAVNADYMLWSATTGKNADNLLYCAKQDYVRADKPYIDSLYTDAAGEFNNSGEEWNWFAYKIYVPTAGTYTLGVKVSSAKFASYKIPLSVNHQVYTLNYTAKAQTQTVDVVLPAGEHTVVMFMPMRQNAASAENNVWNDYPWCNVASVIVDSALTVSAPTVAEVEAAVAPKSDTVVAATNTGKVLRSAAVGDNGNGYLEFNSRDAVKADLPYIESLQDDAAGEFNKSGEEWGWFACKVSVPAAGTYTLTLQVQGCRNAPYYMPLYVNGAVYTLEYAKTGRQSVSVDVALTVGEHTVVIFMPMPKNAGEITGQTWVDYPWCNPERVTVDAELSVLKPTVAEVEACFPVRVKEDTVLSAADANYVIWSAGVKADNGYLERKDNAYRENMIEDAPYVDSIYKDAIGQFNKPGEEWVWFAYNVTAPKAGDYTLGINISNIAFKKASYKIPLCVNGKVYTLTCDQKPQTVTTNVQLTAGKHTVVVFFPMPQNAADYTKAGWEEYYWMCVDKIIVDADLTASKPTVEEVEDCFPKVDTVIPAVDTGYILHSATIKKNAAALGRTDQATLKADAPSIATLYFDACGQFNKTDEEWNWFAFKVTVPESGTYKLGVKTVGSKYASYQIPLCIGGQTYALQYSEKAQAATVEVALSAGEHVVVAFMPLPANKAAVTGNEWNDYHWCDVESITAGYGLTVTKPTVEEVEAVFAPKVLSATDADYVLMSKPLEGYAGKAYLERGTDGARDDKPYIDSLYEDAYGRFNKSGEEWSWFACKVQVPAAGSYMLGLETVGCKYAAYQIPLCVNGETYVLSYTDKMQTVTAEAELDAGWNVIVMFMPIPRNSTGIQNNVWNDYPWCNIASIQVPAGMKVTKPTVTEVEACFPDPVADSVLKEKSVLFVGDSITHSADSWASVIGKAYRMDWSNAGVSGASVSDLRDKIIRHQLMLNSGKDYDYVIMHGGINDTGAKVGTVSDSWSVADFDASTYAGALETMFYYAYENFGGAKLGYIVNYATPNSDPVKWEGTQDMSAYFTAGKQVCEKWGISYIDLYSGTAPDGKSYSYDILNIDEDAGVLLNHDPSEIHLSAEGYNRISPYIADWMETLTVKASPVPAQNSGKHINANNTDKVLHNNFTLKNEHLDWTVNVGLQDRKYEGMAADQANIEILPYAKDLLGKWAFASIAVNVPADGEYTFKAEMAAKVACQMGMLVDGEVYTLKYGKKDGYYEFMEQTVALTAGTHYITFTAAMPNNDNELDGDAWNLYPWTNISAIVVDEGVEVLAKPALEDVISKLKPYEPFYTRVEAENTEYVVYNNYNTPNEANDKASGGYVVGGSWNSAYKQTFEELEGWLNVKGNAYVEYTVVAPADGEYDIRVGFLAGSGDKSVAKPYIAVIVNDTTYKAQFTKNWNQVDKVKLTVTLKEGLNIIRCTGITTEQEIYGVKGWINHDFIDLDKRLTAAQPSSVTVEAENLRCYNKLKVQDGGKDEKASGKVLGSSDRKYVKGLWYTLDQIGKAELKQIPYMAVTVTAPRNGYYPISVNMAGDGRLKKCTVGMIVDGVLTPVTYTRTDKTTEGAKVYALVYLTAGDHVITFTTPMPAGPENDVDYSYLWANFDFITLHNGLSYAEKQNSPTHEGNYVRVEMEDFAYSNLARNNGTAIGNAYYKSSQSVAEMLENGIDGGRTPYTEFTVKASKAGTYVMYLGVAAGMTEGSTWGSVAAKLVADVNGKLQMKTVLATKSTEWTVIPLWMNLVEGENTIRLTHLGSDSNRGGTTWIDFDYIEMPTWTAQYLEFGTVGERMEAETARFSGFAESTGSAYSGGRYLGRANYDTVAEVNITFDTLDPADLDGLPYVTYRVFAEKAGTYPVAVGFAAGLTNYPAEEYRQGVPASFAAIVNGESKQRVEFTLCSPSANMTRLILLELKEGENEVTFTGTTSEYVIDRIPRNDETYRLVWIDQDYLLLSEGLSNLGQETGQYDVEDSGYDFSQLVPRDPSDTPAEQPDVTQPVQQSGIPAIIWILCGVGAAGVMIIILLLAKKRKKDEET